MEVEILYRPSSSLGVLKLKADESVLVEPGRMVSMSVGVGVQTGATGGYVRSFLRKVLGGEGFFQNTFTAPSGGGEVCVAPSLPGDIMMIDLNQETFLFQVGAFLASEDAISIEPRWGGKKSLFASQQFVMLCASGIGKILISSYGAAHEKILKEGELYTVDSGHLLGFSESIQVDFRPISNIQSTLLSGEGFVIDVQGPGRILIQTRSTQAFLDWITTRGGKRPSAPTGGR
jgi:uncharacterized protein (TIGR00266 family)